MPEQITPDSPTRRVFTYERGGRTVAVDPREARRRMQLALGAGSFLPDYRERFQALSDAAGAADPAIAEPASERLAEVARAGFRLTPLAEDGTGTTEDEALALLKDFFVWSVAADAPASAPPAGEAADTLTDASAPAEAPAPALA